MVLFQSEDEKRESLPISQVPERQQCDRERRARAGLPRTHTGGCLRCRRQPGAGVWLSPRMSPQAPCPKATPHRRVPVPAGRRPGAPRPAPARPGQIRKFPRRARPPPPVPTQAGHVQHAGDAAVAHVHLGLVLLPALLHDLLQGLGHGLGRAEMDTVSRAAGETRRGLQPGQRRDSAGPERPKAENPPAQPAGGPVPSRPPRPPMPAGHCPGCWPHSRPGQATGPALSEGTHRARCGGTRREAMGSGGAAGGSHGGTRAGPADPVRAAPPPRAGAAQRSPALSDRRGRERPSGVGAASPGRSGVWKGGRGRNTLSPK